MFFPSRRRGVEVLFWLVLASWFAFELRPSQERNICLCLLCASPSKAGYTTILPMWYASHWLSLSPITCQGTDWCSWHSGTKHAFWRQRYHTTFCWKRFKTPLLAHLEERRLSLKGLAKLLHLRRAWKREGKTWKKKEDNAFSCAKTCCCESVFCSYFREWEGGGSRAVASSTYF